MLLDGPSSVPAADVPEASMPSAIMKPLSWQKAEPSATGPLTKTTMGYIRNHSALNMSLWINNMTRLPHVSTAMPSASSGPAYSCLKLLRIFKNQ